MQLLTGCKHNSEVNHKPEKLADLWNQYISRSYATSPDKGFSFICNMLVLEPPSTLGQSAGLKRGGIMKKVDSRTLTIKEIEALKAIKEKLIEKEKHSLCVTSHTVTNTVMEEPPTKRLKIQQEQKDEDHYLARIKAHKEIIKKREPYSKKELERAPSVPWAVRLSPKKKSEKIIEAIEDLQPTLAIEDAGDDIDAEDGTPDTDVEDPPPCPVHLMQ